MKKGKQTVSTKCLSNRKNSGLLYELRKNWIIYLMFLPVAAYYILFCYKPMYGALIAFQNYTPSKGMLGSQWVGFKHFIDFFSNYYFWRILKNTLVISVTSIVFGFPAPILLALLLNEITGNKFKRTVQTISYIPHFISLVVICGMIKSFTSDNGIITSIVAALGGSRVSLLSDPKAFVPIYVISDIWQGIGWGSILYLAAITGINQELYEAAEIDGANRWRQTLCVTLPGIAETIIIMLILRLGSILNVGYEKIILLYNEMTRETADVISSFVYRKGLLERSWSYSSAVGLFNSVVNFGFVIVANAIARRFSDTSLW